MKPSKYFILTVFKIQTDINRIVHFIICFLYCVNVKFRGA